MQQDLFISSLTTAALLSADDQVVFSQRAVELIHAHDQKSGPFYCYLAYHNVHDACTADRFAGGLDAPMGTVDLCKPPRYRCHLGCILLEMPERYLCWQTRPR